MWKGTILKSLQILKKDVLGLMKVKVTMTIQMSAGAGGERSQVARLELRKHTDLTLSDDFCGIACSSYRRLEPLAQLCVRVSFLILDEVLGN